MSREIEFKVWDKQNKTWYKPIHKAREGKLEDLWLSLIGDCHIGMRGLSSMDCRDEIQDRFQVVQYTGLKDKNGKKIFEGDIIKFGNWMNPSESTEVKNEVVVYNVNKCAYDGIYPSLYPWRMCEVIGNIYENPELLTIKDTH